MFKHLNHVPIEDGPIVFYLAKDQYSYKANYKQAATNATRRSAIVTKRPPKVHICDHSKYEIKPSKDFECPQNHMWVDFW